MEYWKPVVGYERLYEVSDLGRVRTIKTGKFKTHTVSAQDRRHFMLLWKKNKPALMRVHRLVLLAFKGPPPRRHESCHNDGNPEHNHLSNLRWDTRKSNHADRIRHGTTNRGEQCGTSKLTTKQVLAIRKDQRLQREIAADYGILQNHVSRIKNRVRWAHV